MMPWVRIDCASSARRSGRKTRRGCRGFGSIESIGAEEAVSPGTGSGSGREGARVGSRALSPLPSALRGVSTLFMVQDLFRELNVTLRATGAGIVAENGLAEAWRLRQSDAAGNDGSKHLVAEELTQVRRYLAREVGAVVVHR